MSDNQSIGTSGVKRRGDAVRRDILFGAGGLLKKAGGFIIDGANARDLGNTGDLDTLRAGILLGKISASGKYGVSIVGATGQDHDTSATPNALTVSVAVAIELARRVGQTGDFKITGPPTANGVVVTESITAVSIDTGSGVIDITGSSTSADFASGSFIQPADGSETILGLLVDPFGKRVTDEDRANQDVEANLLIGGQVDTDKVIDYPTDTSLKTFIKDALRAVGIGFSFKDDFS